jgi:hypothetical protein
MGSDDIRRPDEPHPICRCDRVCMTCRWREQDSNHRFRGGRAQRFGLRLTGNQPEATLRDWSCHAGPMVRILFPPPTSLFSPVPSRTTHAEPHALAAVCAWVETEKGTGRPRTGARWPFFSVGL